MRYGTGNVLAAWGTCLINLDDIIILDVVVDAAIRKLQRDFNHTFKERPGGFQSSALALT